MDINALLTQAHATQQAAWYIFFLAFLSGVLVSFTPCVYPMIPITAGILQAQAGRSFWYNFASSIAYVIGIALVYALLGYVSATTSIVFGKWLANPWFIGLIIIFFLSLALAMFGFYELYIPHFLAHRDTVSSKSTIFNSFIFGMISGTVASPCLTPALALLLGIVAKQANPLLGFFTLFSFSLGMGILLLLIGTFSSTLTMLPRAGEWMEMIKKFFGFLMLATCVYFLQPFFSSLIILGAYACIAAVAALYYLAHARSSRLSLIFGILSLLGTLALAGMALKIL